MPKKYPIYFRLGARVDLTKEEIEKVSKGDCASINRIIKDKEVVLGAWDSYIPGPWIEENNELPNTIKNILKQDGCFDDVSLDLDCPENNPEE